MADLSTGHAVWATTRSAQQRVLSADIYGMSNASLDTPWTKVSRLERSVGALVAQGRSTEQLTADSVDVLAERSRAPHEWLPSNGIGIRSERQLSSSFIHIPQTDTSASADGTRCSTVLVVEDKAAKRDVKVVERRFDATGTDAGQTGQRFALGTHCHPILWDLSASRDHCAVPALDPIRC